MRRENELLETYKSLKENRNRLAEAESRKINESVAKRENFKNNYYAIREMKARKDAEHATLMEAARNDALATVIKSIYITALEANTLTDDGIILAESMVDTWIKESGGASKILNKVGNNTYLLARITQIVEDAAQAEVKEIESDEEDSEDVADGYIEGKKDAALAATTDFIKSADKEQVKDFMNKVIDSIQDKRDGVTDDDKANNDVELELPPEEDNPPSPNPEENSEKVETPSEEPEGKEAEDNTVDLTKDDDKAKDPLNTTFDDEDETEKDNTVDLTKDDTVEPATNEPATEEEPEAVEPSDGKEAEDNTVDLTKDDNTEPAAEEPSEGKEAEDNTVDLTKDDTAEPAVEEPSEGKEEPSTEEPIEKEESESEDEVKKDIEKAESDAQVDEELGEPLDDDGIDQDITVDGDTENKGKVFDQLDKEEDVQKAIDLIRTRVADAEETFIRNNAEDKKKIDELLNKISNNVKTVNDLDDANNTKSKIAEESARMYKRQLDAIRNYRPTTVFESMTRNITKNIVVNESVRDKYLAENGTLDIALVVESAKIMYAFLETINTLQLEKVDNKYIAKTLDEM